MKSPQAFRSIGEVARLVGVATHVLRYWETQFPALAPVRRPDGRRYYRPDDLLLAAGLCEIMREDGLTIRGAQRLIALDKGASLRDRGRLRLEAVAERKAADAAANRRRGTTVPRARAPRNRDQAEGAVAARQEPGQGPAVPAVPGQDGQAAVRGTNGPAVIASGSSPVGAPSATNGKGEQARGDGPTAANATGEIARAQGATDWLQRLTATAAALRAREHPLPPDARALHEALRRMQGGRP